MKRGALRWMSVIMAAAGVLHSICAAAAPRPLSHFSRDLWSLQQGLPTGTIYGIGQSADGYLWVGADKGLYRFDGLSFRLFSHANTPSLSAGPVLGLVSDKEGNLWIRTQGPSLTRYRDGTFQEVRVISEQSDYSVTAIGPGWNSGLLLAYRNAVMRYADGKLTPIDTAGHPLLLSIGETPDREIWMGTRDEGLWIWSQGRTTMAGDRVRDRKINTILPVDDRNVWVGTDNGVLRWDGSELSQSGLPQTLLHTQILSMTLGKDSNIWIGTANEIWCLTPSGASCWDEPALSSQQITALFADREGDVWVGSERGLERFRYNLFSTYLAQRENNGPIYIDNEDRIWFGPATGGLFWLKGDKTGQATSDGLDKDVVYSIAGSPGEIWIGRRRGGLTRLRFHGGDISATTYTQSDGLAQNSVYAVFRSRDGAVWAGTVNGGLSRFSEENFTNYTTANGLASDSITAIEQTPDGAMWFATPNGLNSFSNNRWKLLSGADGLPPGTVDCLFADSGGALWIGTSKGIGVLKGGRLEFQTYLPAPLREEIFGITEDRLGWLWIATSEHLLRVKRSGLVNGAIADGDIQEFSAADGLAGTQGVKRFRSVVNDPSGRVWVSLNRGISVVDPNSPAPASVPALIHIENLSADGRNFSPLAPVRIPSGQHRITIEFAGLSLAMPERVHFRYRLDGYDSDWSESTAARKAEYTNLEPRAYRFRVVASTSESVWNSREAVLGFEIEPALWQTWWFRLGLPAACILAVLMFYRYRLQQVTRQLNVRFEERLAERTRIAQDLHDTLLQGFLSASMQLHVAIDALPPDAPARPGLARILQLMRGVTDEARNAVRGLRSPDGGDIDLVKRFSDVRDEFHDQTFDFRVIVEGQPRPLRPMLGAEVYRIGREALVNSFRHSKAKHIEVEVEFTSDQLRVLVRDDGCGIDPQVLSAGREGHWGLPGMRERAEQIGARLTVWSGAGTEVELSVPARVAFPDKTSRWYRNLLERLGLKK